MKTLRPSRIASERYFQTLSWLLLVLLSTLSVWGPSQRLALGQAVNTVRFTQDLKFHEVAPGIEHGQVTSGHTSKEELTGPLFINVLHGYIISAVGSAREWLKHHVRKGVKVVFSWHLGICTPSHVVTMQSGSAPTAYLAPALSL